LLREVGWMMGRFRANRGLLTILLNQGAAPAFSPADLDGLELWLDFSDVSTLYQTNDTSTPVTSDGQTIGYVGDKSGNSRHATIATAGQRPLYKINVQNGKSAALYDGIDDRLITPDFTIAQPNTTFTVFKRTFPTGEGALADGVTTRQQEWITGNKLLNIYAGATLRGGLPLVDDIAMVLDTVWNGATSRSFINGVFNENGSRDNPGTNSMTGGTKIGWSADIPFSGHYMERIVCSGELSATQTQQVRSYLMTKWSLAATYPSTRYAGNPIIVHQAETYKDNQVMEPCIMVDPTDATRLLMYFSGCPTAGGGGVALATASISNPFVWTEYESNPLFSATPETWEAGGTLRLGSMLYIDGTYYCYYSAGDADGHPRIGLATSTDGINFTKHASNPILTPTAPDIEVALPAVLKEGANWYMYFAHSTAAAHDPSIKLATSSDGISWTDTGTEVWAIDLGEFAYDRANIEWHQIIKLGTKYTLVSEVYDDARERIALAQCDTPNGTFTKLNQPIFHPSGTPGSFDIHNVATAAIYKINGIWYIYYVGSAAYGAAQYNNPWDMGMAELGWNPEAL